MTIMNIMIYMVQGRELHAGKPARNTDFDTHQVSHGCIAWLFVNEVLKHTGDVN